MNVGGGLWDEVVKLVTCSDIPGRRVDVWRSGTFLEMLQVSECTTNQNYRPWRCWTVDVGQSWWHFSGPKSLHTSVQKGCATWHLDTSLHVTSFTGPHPVIVLKVTNTGGVGRPGMGGYYHGSACIFNLQLLWNVILVLGLQTTNFTACIVFCKLLTADTVLTYTIAVLLALL